MVPCPRTPVQSFFSLDKGGRKMKIEVLYHASIKLTGEKVIYIDPYHIEEEYHDADFILITHDHFDHYETESIEKVRKPSTKIIVPTILKQKPNDLVVEPGNHYELDGLSFETIRAYNLEKPFHPIDKNYVGYLLHLDKKTYYIMGDTDRTPETDKVKTDVCFVPIGGTYTMDAKEAASYINETKPSLAIPIHYGSVVGEKKDAETFKSLVDKEIKVEEKL